MIRCTCGAELFSIESICSACLPPKPPRALFVEDLRIKLANREEELLDWKETVELVNTENVELRAERDRLKAALEKARHELVTHNGLYATDIYPENREQLLQNGVNIEWQIDVSAVLETIDAALGGAS